MEIRQARQRYFHWLETARDLSPDTIRAYAADVSALEKYLGQDAVVSDISREQMASFIESLRATPLRPRSVRRRAAGARGFCRWLVAQELIETDPWLGIRVAVGRGRMLPRFVPSDDLDRIMVMLRGRVERSGTPLAASVLAYPFESTTLLGVALMVSTGIRVGELVGIDCRNINIAGRTIRIVGKGRRERFVYLINHWVSELTLAYLAMRDQRGTQHHRLLLNIHGEPLTSAAMRSRLAKLGVDARVSTKITPHMLRHTAATQLLEAGVDIRQIQHLLGHASLSTTEIYTHVSNHALQRVVEEADVLGRSGQRG